MSKAFEACSTEAKLAFYGPLLGVVLGSFVSVLITIYILSEQGIEAERLSAKIKLVEIEMTLMNDVRKCKEEITSLGATDYSHFKSDAKSKLASCRYQFRPSLVGLRVIGEEFKKRKATELYLKLDSLDENIQNVIKNLQTSIEANKEDLSEEDRLSDKVLSLIKSENSRRVTIASIEHLLL